MAGRLRAGIALAVFVPVTAAAALAQIVVLRTGLLRPTALPLLWHRLILRLIGVRVHPVGRPAAGRPLLVAANHVSWIDIPVLGALLPASFVAKADMAGWPVFGLLARLSRSVFVDRDRARTSSLQAGELGSRLAAGEAMVLFAEGTTADGNAIDPFKSTLFGAARAALAGAAEDQVVLVQPVTIAYTRRHGIPMGRYHRRHVSWIGDSDLVPHVVSLIRQGGVDVEVHFGAPVPFSRGSDRKAVARAVEAEVRATLAQALRNPLPPAGSGRSRPVSRA